VLQATTRRPSLCAEWAEPHGRTGLRQLWRERIFGRYLRGEISRDEAIETAGIDWVELADLAAFPAWSDGWSAYHRKFEKEGKLDYTLEQCPYRNKPAPVRE
jgi:hypothetical protein